jgi:uncharacterized protein YkwD
MLVRRLLVPSLLVIALLATAVPASAGPRTNAAFIRATNADRRAAGRPALAKSHTLAMLAVSHSAAMARRSARRYGGRCDARALWHNDISKTRGRWVWLGQNVGCGPMGADGVAASVRRLEDAFMHSPGHRRNLLYRKANLVGVGTVIKKGIIWVTVNFEQSRPA